MKTRLRSAWSGCSSALPLDQTPDGPVPHGPDAFHHQRVERDGEDVPSFGPECVAELADFEPEPELLGGTVGHDGEAVVAHRADLRAAFGDQVLLEGDDGLVEVGSGSYVLGHRVASAQAPRER